MFISDSKIEANKQRFLSVLNTINRVGINVSGLVERLNSSDFFTAPASTKYHNSVKGGLCDHCLNVYDNLSMLVEAKGLKDIIPEDSIKIVALMHDISKMDFYREDYRNKKVYCDEGTKQDAGGMFEWQTEKTYQIRPKETRFLFGNHESTSEFITRLYIPLTIEESSAILNHMGGLGYDSAPNVSNDVFERNKLAALLFEADFMATFIDEQ